MRIYDVLGHEVVTLAQGHYTAGSYEATWNGYDKRNNPVASGVYFYVLNTENFRQVKKMKLKIALITTVALLAVSCTEKVSKDGFLSQPGESYQASMTQGWDLFSSGDYSGAYDAFAVAAEREATLPEVYLGMGWSALRNQNLEEAQTNLGSAIAFAFLDSVNAATIRLESEAGIAGIALADGDYQTARDTVTKVLSMAPNFVFSHDSNVNAVALKKILATAAYYQDDYSVAFQQVLDMNLTVSGVEHVTPAAGEMNGTVTANGDTPNNGIAKVTVSSAHKLILVVSATSATTDYQINSIDEGTNAFTVFGNPPLQTGDQLSVEYYYTTDYGKFLSDLIGILQ